MTGPADGDPFREYHRARLRERLIGTASAVAVAVGVVAGLTAIASAAPPPAVVSASGPPVGGPSSSPDAAEAPEDPDAAPEPVDLPAPAQPSTPVPTPAPTPADSTAGPREWAIAIDATGYQAEIDQCLWVRMDLAAAAPIVGAHNYCGGSIVLEMAVGDVVTLTGTGLDGRYRVSEERLAWAGQNAAEATAGLSAAVILQTCFWVDDGSERLLALLPD